MFRFFFESSFSDLYQSAVDAFPHTTKRQHATGPIEISEISILPFLGMKTLLLRCLATNEDRQYRPLILFRNVQYGKGKSFRDQDGLTFQMEQPSLNNEVNIRCQCGDFKWRFHHEDWNDRSLYGANRKPYEAISDRGPVNPTEAIGCCKHLMKLAEILRSKKILV